MQLICKRIFFRSLFCALLTSLPYLSLFAESADSLRTYELKGVIVNEKARPATTRSAAPLQTLSTKQIKQLPTAQLSDAVKRFAGVSVKDYGGIGGLKTVSIRNMGSLHTGVIYDGIALSDCQSGQIDISRFSLSNVSELSLTIGQGNDIYQSAKALASSGILNIVSDQADSVFVHRQKIRANITTGSYGLANSSVFYNYRFSSKLAVAAHAEYLRADGRYSFSIPSGKNNISGKRINSDIESWRGELNINGNITNRQQWKLKGYFYDSERGLPGPVIKDNPYSAERLFDRNYFVQLGYENKLSDQFKIKSAIKWNYAWNRDYNKQAQGITDDRFTQKETYATATAFYSPLKGLAFSVSEDFSYNDLCANTYQHQYPERYSSLSAFAAQYENKRITATASLLYTFITERVKSGNVPEDCKKWSPALSVSVRPFTNSAFRIRTSYKDIFRVPTFNDMYYLVIGNTDLKPEKARQVNLGLLWSGAILGLDYLYVSTDAYYNRISDKIVAIPTMFIWRMTNADKTEGWGTDIQLTVEKDITNHLRLTGGATYNYMYAVNISNRKSSLWRNQLPYTPKHSGNGYLNIETPWLEVSYNVNYASVRYRLALNEAANRIDGYSDHSVSLSHIFHFKQHSLTLKGTVSNIGNHNYEIIKYYPMAPRNYRLSVYYAF